MTPAQIAAMTAARKRAALDNLRGARIEARERANELYTGRKANTQAAALRSEERDLVEGHNYDLYPTPAGLAAEMVEIANERSGDSGIWLEPEAGTGRIAEAIKTAGHDPLCIEINYQAARLLQGRGFTVINKDFLTWDGDGIAAVVMNPPFSNGQDIEHVLHAYSILDEGGVIVAIMSEGTFYRSDKKSAAFRDWFNEVGGESRRLPAGTFRTSGTMVNSRLVIIEK